MNTSILSAANTSMISHGPGGLNYCSNCHYNIENEAEYKEHYKSDFHRYNIKRKLVNLQPTSYETYLKKKGIKIYVNYQKQSMKPKNNRALFKYNNHFIVMIVEKNSHRKLLINNILIHKNISNKQPKSKKVIPKLNKKNLKRIKFF